MQNIMSMIGQFAPIIQAFKSGGGNINPMSLMNMLGKQGGNQGLVGYLSKAQEVAQQQGSNLEQYVIQEFKKSGLDIQEVRRTLGI